MSKRNKDDEVSRLEKEVRELKSMNRSLLKHIKKVDREYHKAFEEMEEDPPEIKKVSNNCTNTGCNSGQLIVVEIGAGREITRCTNCKYRSKARKI